MKKFILILFMCIMYLAIWQLVLDSERIESNFTVIEVKVMPGDTAWDLVREVNDKAIDPREGTHVFKQLNGSYNLEVGSYVKVPAF